MTNPTGGRQTSWLFTKRGPGAGLEPGASRLQVQRL